MASYALEQLFVDQGSDLVIDTIASVLAWVPGKSKKRGTQPFTFQVEHRVPPAAAKRVSIDLTWNIAKLQALVPGVQAHATRLATGVSAQREHVAELAAYGLAMVGISVLMPGIRILAFRRGLAPDLLFDVTPAALRGVEVAGRTKGGWNKLKEIRDGSAATKKKTATAGKASQLRARADVAEAHLSLFCASPRVALKERVKP